MCADPKMQRLLWAELREELASRKAIRNSGSSSRAPVFAKRLLAPFICLVVVAIALAT